MSKLKDRTIEIFNQLKESGNKEIIDKADLLAFVISLFPVPGVQQAAQIADRILQDKQASVIVDEINEKMRILDDQYAEQDSSIEKLSALVNAIGTEDQLRETIANLVEQMVNELKEEDSSEFVMETTNWSVQKLISQLIEVDWAAIIAENHSHNVLKGTKIKAKKTHLRANDHSSNILDGTEFSDGSGSVKMQGITQTGNVSVTGNSVGFHGNSSLIFGAKPDTVSGNCPSCNHFINIPKANLSGYTHFKCPNCGNVFEIRYR